jgi:hypothetical protein
MPVNASHIHQSGEKGLEGIKELAPGGVGRIVGRSLVALSVKSCKTKYGKNCEEEKHGVKENEP